MNFWFKNLDYGNLLVFSATLALVEHMRKQLEPPLYILAKLKIKVMFHVFTSHLACGLSLREQKGPKFSQFQSLEERSKFFEVPEPM